MEPEVHAFRQLKRGLDTRMKVKILRRWRVVLVVVLVAVAGWVALAREEPLDLRFSGAYRLDDGRLVLVTPREGATLRYRMMSGESRALWPVGDLVYEAGPGWSERQPVEVTATFDRVESGPPAGLDWVAPHGEQRARRLELPEILGSFTTGELELRAKLVLPEGDGPFPAVVFVHGSGRASAVDTYYNPYLFAAHGIAGLVYDKRGTGGSEGDFSQNFHVLSDDTAAAVEWLRRQPEIDADDIHLAGYSQGGWIAPLAATKIYVRSLLICYGPMVPVTEEDRWGYIHALAQAGFGPEAVREVDEIDTIISDIMDHRADRWGELKAALEAAEERDWYEAIEGSDSLVGFFAATRVPWPGLRLYGWWFLRRDPPFIDRLYDPVPTVAALATPSLWIFGGDDSSMPTGRSIDELETLQEAGRPIEIEVFSEAEHGILLFEEKDDERALLGYAPGYLDLQVDWIRHQSDLLPEGGTGRPPLPPTPNP